MTAPPDSMHEHPVVVGAGPAGLAAATALVERGILPVVIERDAQVGGIAKTVEHQGNRMDLGGHRFFSKSPEVMSWWLARFPLEDDELTAATGAEEVMLLRTRLSRILFLGRFFDYPVSVSVRTFRNLGLARTLRIGVSYLWAVIRPIKPERSLADFMTNRFGSELYQLFFKDYTEKVWGVPCDQIGRDWGAQRIKGLSVRTAIAHALLPKRRTGGIEQAGTETSLIGQFLYPKYGPGQLWERVAHDLEASGCDVRMTTDVVGVNVANGLVESIEVEHVSTGERETVPCSALLSTMPVRDLVGALCGIEVPDRVRSIAEQLPYRDFMTCGLLVSRLRVSNRDGTAIADNWIYVQEREVRIGRLQVFNNWSPYLVADEGTVWLGLEYFCNEGDELWEMPDERFAAMAAEELASIGIIDADDVLSHTVYRVPKAYPAYFGTYANFAEVREWLDTIPNLFLMGRNGMHRYNNMDHSMLSAWAAVDALTGEGDRERVWSVNAEEESVEGE